MKHIRKQLEPQAFTDWKNLTNEDWQASYDDLSGIPKKAVVEALIIEQGGLCCYCERPLEKGDSRHCGNSKGNWFDTKLLISPLDSSCENRFTFTGNGKIQPTSINDQAAHTTIEKLNLDIAKLNALRMNALIPFLDDDLNEDELRQFVRGYLQTDKKGHYAPFWTTISNVFKTYTLP